jgi:hypothetical protein
MFLIKNKIHSLYSILAFIWKRKKRKRDMNGILHGETISENILKK